MDELRNILEKIESLFRKYRLGQVDFILKLLTLLEMESPELKEELCSGEMWGGSGSVCDVILCSDIGSHDREITPDPKDDRDLRNLLIELVEVMEAQGIVCKGATEHKNTYKEWNLMDF